MEKMDTPQATFPAPSPEGRRQDPAQHDFGARSRIHSFPLNLPRPFLRNFHTLRSLRFGCAGCVSCTTEIAFSSRTHRPHPQDSERFSLDRTRAAAVYDATDDARAHATGHS